MKYISGPYTQGQLLKEITEIEMALTNRFDISGVITDAAEKNSWKERVEEASFGRNTVIFDDQGNPNIMVVVPHMTEADLIAGGANAPHPAFVVNGATKARLYISKYQCFTTGAGATLRAVGLKHKDPGNTITFDNALLACKQKGAGWHLMTNAEWAAIALWCKKQGFLPRGNNNYGKDYAIASEKGDPSYYYSGNIGRVATGSGPLPWSHDGSPFGIFDLNGNVWEWVGGFRINNGEIQVLQDNNAADNTKDQGVASAEWKAILQDGSLVAPGTANALKYDATGAAGTGSIIVKTGAMVNLDASTSVSALFKDIAADAGVTIPNILKSLGVFPVDTAIPTGRVYARTGERLPYRGGRWDVASDAGLFSLGLINLRSSTINLIGFRSAFVI